MNGGTFTRLRDAIFLVSLLLFVFVFFSPSSEAVINRQINFQGKLTNTDGTNVTDGNYSIAFNIYTVASGGSSVWTETHGTVSVTDGIFRVDLGSITSLPGSVDFNNSSLYLGITVGADPEMTPRVRFNAAPYAFNSDELDGIDSSGFVQVAPSSVQTDASTNALIFLNKTSSGNLIQLQQSAADEFVVDNSGIVTTASINSGSIVDGTVANGDLVNDSVTVSAGSGLITGGSVALGASVTLDIGAGNGIVVNANDVALDVLTTGTTATSSSNSGLEVSSDGLRLLGGCGDGDVLAWNGSTNVWQCAANNAVYTGVTSSNQIIGNTTTLTNVTDMNFPIAANEEWYFEFVIQINADANDDLNVAITCPAGATASFGVEAVEQTNSEGDIDCGTRSGLIGMPNGNEVVVVSGTVENGGTAGTVQLQLSENTTADAANNLTIFDGSSIHAMRIPIGTLVGGTGGATYSFDITDSSNTETINDADTVTFAAGSGITVLVSGTDTVTYTSVLGTTIETAEITDGDVTNAKLANDAVTITSGNGLINGGAVALGSSLTLNIGAGNGVVVNADDVGLDVLTTGTTATTASNSGLEVSSDGLRLLGGCADGEALVWDATAEEWECGGLGAPTLQGIPAFGYVAGGTGTLTAGDGASTSRTATGSYTVTFDTAESDANYIVLVSVVDDRAGRDDINITVDNQSTTAFDVTVREGDNGTTADVLIDQDWYFQVIASDAQAAGAGLNSFNINDGSNNEVIDAGDTLTFADGTGLDVLVSATDTVTYSIEDDSLNFAQFADALSLDATTTISLGANNLTTNLDGTGDYAIQFGGNTVFEILDTGAVTIGSILADQTIGIDNGTGTINISTDTDANTTNIGTGTGADTVTIGDGNADVSITDAQWSISAAGGANFATLTGAGLTDCDGQHDKVLWDSASSQFSCGTDRSSYHNVTTADYTNSTTTLTNVTGLSFPIAANEEWIFEARAQLEANTTADQQWGLTAPAGATCDWGAYYAENASGNSNLSCVQATGNMAASNNTDVATILGYINNGGTAGTIQIQHRQNTASGTNTIFAGSYITAIRVDGADYAEAFFSDEHIEPGVIVELAGTGRSQVQRSSTAYSDRQLGIVSTDPGSLLAEPDGSGNIVPVALAGRVPVKLTTENGLPRAGDSITTSSTRPGYGMRAIQSGYIVGQLMLDATDNGDGTADGFVYVRHGYWQAPLTLDISDIVGTATTELTGDGAELLGLETIQNTQYEEIDQRVIDEILRGFGIQQDQIQGLGERIENLEATVIDARRLADAITQTDSGLSFITEIRFTAAVIFDGEVRFSSDTSDVITIPAGTKELLVTFNAPFSIEPNMVVTPHDFVAGQWRVRDITTEEFVLELSEAQAGDVAFTWQAIVAQQQEEEPAF